MIVGNAGGVLWNSDMTPYDPGVQGVVACAPGIASELARSRTPADAAVPVLRKATAPDLAIVRNLVPYYVYDMSESMGWDCNGEGRYDGCDDLPDYWSKPGHHAHVITVQGRVAGFAMARPCPCEPDRMEVGEFFVLRRFRGRGVGALSAKQLFGAFPGKWLIRVLDGNKPALAFWERVIARHAVGDVRRTSETYECPHSGRWPMQFFRFACSPGR